MVRTGGMPLGFFTDKRTYTLTIQPDGSVEFQMQEAFSGLIASLIIRLIPNLQPSFEEFASCLKASAEASQNGSTKSED